MPLSSGESSNGVPMTRRARAASALMTPQPAAPSGSTDRRDAAAAVGRGGRDLAGSTCPSHPLTSSSRRSPTVTRPAGCARSASVRPGIPWSPWSVSVGDRGVVRGVVTDDDTAVALGSGGLPVLGTPRLLAWCEAATCRALEGRLPTGSSSVGTAVRAGAPRRPARWGSRSPWSPWWRRVDGPAIGFAVEATDAGGTVVGRGTVERVVVDDERFLARLAARARVLALQPGLRACSVYDSGSRSASSTRRHSSRSPSRTIRPGRASHGTLRCSTNPVTSNPRASRAVRISPMPWFQDSWRVLTNSWSFST